MFTHATRLLSLLARTSPRHHGPSACGIPVKINVAVSLEDGVTEMVTLASDNGPAAVAADLATKYNLALEQQQALEEDLEAQWADGCSNAPDIYVGPMPDENILSNVVSSIELPSVGVVLEVADSVVTDGGRGIFIRCLGETESVTLDEGTAVCGYADGTMEAAADSDKSVAFALTGARVESQAKPPTNSGF